MGPAGSPIRPQGPPAPSLCSPLSPQHCTYPGVHQADAEGDQPQEISVGEGEPLHVEADLLLPRPPLDFMGQMLGSQHPPVVREGIPT